VVENYPVELEAIVMRALAKDLNRRFATARELSRALQQYLMKSGSFMGSDEIGSYVKHVLSERFEKREAHLQWAAEVTQTISLEQLDGGPRELEEVSILTYASDVQEVPKRTGPRPAVAGVSAPRPAAGRPRSATPPPPSQSRNAQPHGAPPRPAAGNAPPRPAAGQGLPSYDLDSASGTDSGLLEPIEEDDELARTTVASPVVKSRGSSRRQPTALGLGPQAEKSGAGSPLPSYEITSSESGAPAAMHDYGEEDDDAVTRVMASPMDEPDAGAISAVHAPAKSVQPAPQPRENIVVSPSAMSHDMPQYSPAPPHVGMQQGMQPGMQMQPGMYPMQSGMQSMPPSMGYGPQQSPQQPQQQSSRGVLIALIAAATTLIALALMALVVLKVTEAPAPAAGGTAPNPTAQNAAQPANPTAPVPAPTTGPSTAAAQPKPTVAKQPEPQPEKAIDPSSLPTEPKKTTTSHSYAAHPAPTHKSTTSSGGSGAPGYLTVVCDPACDSVVAAGHSLGPSPVVRASLKPGTHAVLLRRSGSPSQSISVTIVSGQTTARRVKMGS
jgi:serine/threonine-protein kinase